jgi:hypothetical protein
MQLMPQKVLLIHALPPGTVAVDPLLRVQPPPPQQHQQQQEPSSSSSRTTSSAGHSSDQETDDADTSGQQEEAFVPTPLQPFLQPLGAFSATWGQRAEGGAMPPPLDMPQMHQAQSVLGGPRVLWWWPCRRLDRVYQKNHMELSKHCLFGLTSQQDVQVSIWALGPASTQPADLQRQAGAGTASAAAAAASAAAAAAAAAAGPGSGTLAAADTPVSWGAEPLQQQVRGPWLEALAHDRVPGAWRHLHGFAARLYVTDRLKLGPAMALHCLRDYPGWHLTRMELVSLDADNSYVILVMVTSGNCTPSAHPHSAAMACMRFQVLSTFET